MDDRTEVAVRVLGDLMALNLPIVRKAIETAWLDRSYSIEASVMGQWAELPTVAAVMADKLVRKLQRIDEEKQAPKSPSSSGQPVASDDRGAPTSASEGATAEGPANAQTASREQQPAGTASGSDQPRGRATGPAAAANEPKKCSTETCHRIGWHEVEDKLLCPDCYGMALDRASEPVPGDDAAAAAASEPTEFFCARCKARTPWRSGSVYVRENKAYCSDHCRYLATYVDDANDGSGPPIADGAGVPPPAESTHSAESRCSATETPAAASAPDIEPQKVAPLSDTGEPTTAATTAQEGAPCEQRVRESRPTDAEQLVLPAPAPAPEAVPCDADGVPDAFYELRVFRVEGGELDGEEMAFPGNMKAAVDQANWSLTKEPALSGYKLKYVGTSKGLRARAAANPSPATEEALADVVAAAAAQLAAAETASTFEVDPAPVAAAADACGAALVRFEDLHRGDDAPDVRCCLQSGHDGEHSATQPPRWGTAKGGRTCWHLWVEGLAEADCGETTDAEIEWLGEGVGMDPEVVCLDCRARDEERADRKEALAMNAACPALAEPVRPLPSRKPHDKSCRAPGCTAMGSSVKNEHGAKVSSGRFCPAHAKEPAEQLRAWSAEFDSRKKDARKAAARTAKESASAG